MNPAPPAPTPGFTGLFIPVEILDMPELSHTDHMLLAWIDALSKNAQKACFASNDYFAKKLRLKENTVKILISKLVGLGLVERHSFDGRQRLLRTCKENWFNRDSQSTAEVDLNQPQTLKKINPCGGFKSTPSYIDNSIDKRLDSPLSPPHFAREEPKVAIAPEKREISSSKKSKVSDFSPEVKELAEKMVNALHEANPDWLIPKNLHPIMTQIDEMITKETRQPKKILDVFMWAVCDDFWISNLCKPNPAKYLREKFATLAEKMKAKASNPNKVDRRLKNKEGQAVDEYKDLMF